jgi:hypothetical protein
MRIIARIVEGVRDLIKSGVRGGVSAGGMGRRMIHGERMVGPTYPVAHGVEVATLQVREILRRGLAAILRDIKTAGVS